MSRKLGLQASPYYVLSVTTTYLPTYSQQAGWMQYRCCPCANNWQPDTWLRTCPSQAARKQAKQPRLLWLGGCATTQQLAEPWGGIPTETSAHTIDTRHTQSSSTAVAAMPAAAAAAAAVAARKACYKPSMTHSQAPDTHAVVLLTHQQQQTYFKSTMQGAKWPTSHPKASSECSTAHN
jgi:hypothetical protein